jgi:hypothetical protein
MSNNREPRLAFDDVGGPIWPDWSSMSEGEKRAWDPILDEYQEHLKRAEQKTGKCRKAVNLRDRHVGVPFGFIEDVAKLNHGQATLLVAIHIYRQTTVQKSKTIGLLAAELERWGVDRKAQSRAVCNLKAAGFVEAKKSPGRKTIATLLWRL